MRVITIRQPFASLILAGVKRYETRTWPTSYTGPLGIHAAIAPPKACYRDIVRQQLGCSLEELPRGQILGTAELYECLECGLFSPSLLERSIGFWDDPNNFAWCLVQPHLFVQPIPCPGRLGFWTWPKKEVASVA